MTSFTIAPGGVPSLNRPLDPPDEAIRQVLAWLYADRPAALQSREKRERNAKILQRYSNGESVLTIAQDIGLSRRRVRAIIDRER